MGPDPVTFRSSRVINDNSADRHSLAASTKLWTTFHTAAVAEEDELIADLNSASLVHQHCVDARVGGRDTRMSPKSVLGQRL